MVFTPSSSPPTKMEREPSQYQSQKRKRDIHESDESSSSSDSSSSSSSRKKFRRSPVPPKAGELATGFLSFRESDGKLSPSVVTSMFNTVAHLASKSNAMERRIADLEKENHELRQAVDVNAPGHGQSNLWYNFRDEIRTVCLQMDEIDSAVTAAAQETAIAASSDMVGTFITTNLDERVGRLFQEELETMIHDKMTQIVTNIMLDELSPTADLAIEEKLQAWEEDLHNTKDQLALTVEERASRGITRQIEDNVKYAVIDALAELEDRIDAVHTKVASVKI